ncbi:MAG TPA: type II toxin-antitoxin system RelE/ParE family toxin [Bacteroidia bacterium]|nr:type II toxin-antitoxin system RelE/ParE family toxin [Bacteroidia bacterium]
MDSYRIEWRKSTRKDLRRIAPQEVQRIVSAVEGLVADPFPSGCAKLSGSERAYRIRVGDYRVIYEVIDDVLIIEIIKVGHRRDVYK